MALLEGFTSVFLKFLPNGFVFPLDDAVCLTSTKPPDYFQVKQETRDFQQIGQTPLPSRSNQWGQAVTPPAFYHLVSLYNHPCSSRSGSFWSFLPTLRPFFPREPELKGRTVQQFPSPRAARMPSTHTREMKTAELSPTVNTPFHGAILSLPFPV